MKRINVQPNGSTKVATVKVASFQVIHFIDQTLEKPRPIIIMYGLGEDGVVYEFTGNQWRGYPINNATLCK